MNDNLDGNTAALNAYELEQEKRDRDMEINQDDINIKIQELVVREIEKDGDLFHEAISGEALICYGQHTSTVYHRYIFTEDLLAAVECKSLQARSPRSGSGTCPIARSSVAADRELGRVIRELVTDYITKAQDSI